MSGATHSHHHGEHASHGHGPLQRVLAVLGLHHHDPADSVDEALTATADGIRAVKVSLVVLGVAAAAQAALVLVTGSVALLADTIHNVADALTALPLWVAFVLGRRPPTRRYTYGYGRAEDLAGVFIVAMIALSSLLAGWESVRRLLDPQPLQHPYVVMAAGVVGFVGNEVVAVYRTRVGRRIGSAALVADGLHARTDGFTSLAVVLGAAGSAAGWAWADPAVGLLITVAIGFVLVGAARAVYGRLMDTVDPDLVRAAEDALTATSGVERVDALRLRWVGHRLRGETSLALGTDLSLAQAHTIATTARERLLDQVPRLAEVVVEVAPRTTVAQR